MYFCVALAPISVAPWKHSRVGKIQQALVAEQALLLA
jgi:hypothetical protein